MSDAIDALPTRAQTLNEDEFDRLERTVLAEEIRKANKLLQDVAEYMAEHEARFSEDIFDDLRILEYKLDDYASAVADGRGPR